MRTPLPIRHYLHIGLLLAATAIIAAFCFMVVSSGTQAEPRSPEISRQRPLHLAALDSVPTDPEAAVLLLEPLNCAFEVSERLRNIPTAAPG